MKEIVLGNNSKATTSKLIGSATKSIRSCRGHHRPEPESLGHCIHKLYPSQVVSEVT